MILGTKRKNTFPIDAKQYKDENKDSAPNMIKRLTGTSVNPIPLENNGEHLLDSTTIILKKVRGVEYQFVVTPNSVEFRWNQRLTKITNINSELFLQEYNREPLHKPTGVFSSLLSSIVTASGCLDEPNSDLEWIYLRLFVEAALLHKMRTSNSALLYTYCAHQPYLTGCKILLDDVNYCQVLAIRGQQKLFHT